MNKEPTVTRESAAVIVMKRLNEVTDRAEKLVDMTSAKLIRVIYAPALGEVPNKKVPEECYPPLWEDARASLIRINNALASIEELISMAEL
jgi:hypothetical protein